MFLAQIRSLFTSIDNKPAGFQLDETTFQRIVAIYRFSDSPTQAYLIKELAKRSVLQFAQLYARQMSGEAQQAVLHLLQAVNQQKVILENEEKALKLALFTSKALKVMPGLKVLELSNEEWAKAQTLVEERKAQRLTRKTLLIVLSEVKSTDINKLINDLTKTSKNRTAKPVFNSNKEQTLKLYQRHIPGENRLIFAGAKELHSPLKKTGVRILTSPPRRVVSEKPKVLFSPGESQKIRPVMSKNSGTLYEAVTPEPIYKRIRLTTATAKTLQRKFPGYVYKRPGPINFTITAESIENRKSVKRPASQRQLTGAPSVEIFKVEGVHGDEGIVINGRQCHWSHLIAYFFGGAHSKDNLVPTTAAANYNILDTVERFIADKILNKNKEARVREIRLEVTPYYAPENKGDIPDLLYFNLNWVSPGHSDVRLKEILEIKPDSFRRYTSSMQKSFSVFRKVDEEVLVKKAETNETEQVNPFKVPSPKRRLILPSLSFYQPQLSGPQAMEETDETPDNDFSPYKLPS